MASAQRPANDQGAAPLEGKAPDAPALPTSEPGIAQPTLDAFLAETGEAIASLRETLALIKRETDAMDARRRARRDRINEALERQAERLLALRQEQVAKEA